MTLLSTPRRTEQSAVDARMQRLDAAAHDFGESGHFADFGHVQAGVAQRARGAAGRDQADAEGIEAAGEFNESGLVRYADQCAPDRLQRVLKHRDSKAGARIIRAGSNWRRCVRAPAKLRQKRRISSIGAEA
jgi:hypothetical protein